MSDYDYTAWIMNDIGDDLVRVDLRTLNRDRLSALALEAGQRGDAEMMVTVDRVLHRRGQTRRRFSGEG